MNKVFVITGTRKGIGKGLAEYYLSRGFVVCGCSRGKSSIEHANYRHFSLDVSDEKSVVSMCRSIYREYGSVDVLLNNAGVAAMNHFLTTPYGSAKSLFDTNVLGTFIFSREISKIMMKKKSGNIINYSTVACPIYLMGEAVYASSKSAVETLTKIMAKELAEFGIRVNAIGPTPVETDLIKNVPSNKIEELLNQQSIKRFGTIEDIINLVDFYIDEKSEFVTGQVIYLGGVVR